MSYQRKFCEAVAGILELDKALAAAGNVTVSVEDHVSAADAAKRQLGKLGVLALIATTGHVRAAGAGNSTAGDLGLEITVFENPKLNRATNKDAFTLTQASEIIADALHGKRIEGFANKIRYISMQRADADEGDARMIVVFAVEQSLGLEDPVAWGIDEDTVWGDVTHRKRARGGTPLFEPGRNGKARFIGVQDPHWIISLTCTVAADAPELPELGETFRYGGKEYKTTSAELDETGEGSATVSLSGRTV